MSVRRFLGVLLFLNLGVGFFYIQYHKTLTITNNLFNDTESNIANEVEKMTENGTNETLDKLVFPEVLSSNFLLSSQDLCSKSLKNKSKLSLLILVCTAGPNLKQRATIRETWGSIATSTNNTGYVRLAFLLGKTKSDTLQQQINLESNHFGDIIQQDFVDSYQNLTLKSVMLLKWVTEYCPNVQYILKTDDDMYVNVPFLISTLIKLPIKSNVIYGYLFRKAKPNRNPSAKWFVPKIQFEGDMFPDYLSGTGYVMSRDVVPKLYEASAIVPFLVMEDVYITGLCASEARVKRHNVKGFAYWQRPPTACAFRDAITGHHVPIADMKKIWRDFQRNKPLVCRKKKKK